MRTVLRRRGSGMRRGSALVAVFWMIAVLGLTVFAAIRYVSTDSVAAAALKNGERARRMAEMGMALGAHPDVVKDDPVLRFEDPSGAGFRVVVGREESRLAINEVLRSGQKEVLRRLFLEWGADEALAVVAADSLADWVDEDGEAGNYGAESGWYAAAGMAGYPRNRAFRSHEEILLVRGMDLIAELRPGWRRAFTLWGGGKVDINGAEADVIAAVAGVPRGRAETLVAVRAGYDGVVGSADDVEFRELARVAQILGIASELAEELFVTEGETSRIESYGFAGKVRQKLALVERDGAVLWRGTETETDEDAKL